MTLGTTAMLPVGETVMFIVASVYKSMSDF